MSKIEFEFTTINDGNLAYHVPDSKENVDKNRINLCKRLNIDINNLFYMNQVHGNNVQIVDKNSARLIENCDGIITNEKNISLMVMVADCIPIIFIDRTKNVIAAVHAGRNSTFLKISEITIKKMIKHFNCSVDDIEVVMGPSIQKCCYEVNDEMINIVKKSFGEEFCDGNNIDLQGINKAILNNLEVYNITISYTCTKCSNEPFFSYRNEKKCGRFAAIVSILG